MEVSHDEGVASHIGPESCVACRVVRDEALTGERAGRPSSRTRRLPLPCHVPLAAGAATPQPAGPHDVAADRGACQPMASPPTHPAPLAFRSLHRHTPEVGARCPNGARRVLCGGHEVTHVPTATPEPVEGRIVPIPASMTSAFSAPPRAKPSCRPIRWSKPRLDSTSRRRPCEDRCSRRKRRRRSGSYGQVAVICI